MPAPRVPLSAEVSARLAQWAGRQAGVVTRRQALDAGVTEAQLKTLVRRGEWRRGNNGVLVMAETESAYLASVAERLMAIERRAVISHASAAAVLGLPYVDRPAVPTLTVERAHRGEPGLYVGRLRSVDVTHESGLPITTPARTLVDVMREVRGRDRAQALADGALRSGLELGDVDGALRRAAGWPGVRQARGAWAFADARAESPLESMARVWFRHAELPEPELQVVLGDGVRTARVDFFFRKQRTVVEPDGRMKYDSPEVLWEEKVREDWLRDMGLEVVRATWADRRDQGAALVARVLRAFDRQARRAA